MFNRLGIVPALVKSNQIRSDLLERDHIRCELEGDKWDGDTWDGDTWDGDTWDGDAWDDGTWDGDTWDSDIWDIFSLAQQVPVDYLRWAELTWKGKVHILNS